MDPKLFSSWVHRSVVLLKRGFGRQTSSRWRFSQKNDWIVQVIPQQAIKDKGHTGALYSKSSDPAAGAGMALFTTALGLYGGVLWSGELQGLIIHKVMPTFDFGLWTDPFVICNKTRVRVRAARR
jgi:hypothetical protein